jgi:predicted TIM-barrel fold metal-dependent hydrolase
MGTEEHTAVDQPAEDASPWIVSVDDHVQEPATLWTDRLSRADAELGPHVVRELVESRRGGEPIWGDVWLYEDGRFPILRVSASVGFPVEDVDVLPVTFDEMRPGAYDPRMRVADMDENCTEASLCFPNLFVRFCGQLFAEANDKELAGRCVRAYNDWLYDEWCGKSDGRLFGAMLVPLWDPHAAADEVARNAGRPGCRALTFSEIPSWLGLPSIHSGAWDPLFRACEEANLLVCLHIGSGSQLFGTSADAPSAVSISNTYVTSSLALSDWLLSGVFDRFPGLRILLAEAQAGWIPFLLERLDGLWHQNNAFNRARVVERPPSSYFGPHVSTSIFDDQAAIRQIDEIGAGNVCFEVDYPHPDTTWPRSIAVARKNFGSLDSETMHKLLRGNGLEILGYRPDATGPFF